MTREQRLEALLLRIRAATYVGEWVNPLIDAALAESDSTGTTLPQQPPSPAKENEI